MGERPDGQPRGGEGNHGSRAKWCRAKCPHVSIAGMDVAGASAVQGGISTLGLCLGFSQEMGARGRSVSGALPGGGRASARVYPLGTPWQRGAGGVVVSWGGWRALKARGWLPTTCLGAVKGLGQSFVAVGCLTPARRASPAAGVCSRTYGTVHVHLNAHAWWPRVRGEECGHPLVKASTKPWVWRSFGSAGDERYLSWENSFTCITSHLC